MIEYCLAYVPFREYFTKIKLSLYAGGGLQNFAQCLDLKQEWTIIVLNLLHVWHGTSVYVSFDWSVSL